MNRHCDIEHDGKLLRVPYWHSPEGVWIGYPGGAELFTPKDEQQESGTGGGQPGVFAPMTGKISAVSVAVGDTVSAGDELVILEAMKMEYRLTAPHAGVVRSIDCSTGELCDLGAELIVVAKDDDQDDE